LPAQFVRSAVIRRATPADVQALSTLAATVFRDTYTGLDAPEEIEDYVSHHFSPGAVAGELDDHSSIFLLAFASQQLIGYAQVKRSAQPPCIVGPSPIELARLYLSRASIGQGHGAQLMLAAHAVARSLRCETIWLGVYDRNVRAVEFYRRFGFIRVGGKEFTFGGRIYIDPIMSAAVPATA
jgi:ribosomal protein S18 acetylase RimI-like enzyme